MAAGAAGAGAMGPDARPRRRTCRRLVRLFLLILAVAGSHPVQALEDEPPPLDTDVAEALGEAPADPTVLALLSIVPAGRPIGALALDLPAAGQHWVALARRDYPDNAYDARLLIDQVAPDEQLELVGVPAGQYEIRLFLDWPAGGFTVVSRAPALVSDEPQADRARAARVARVLAALPAEALNDRLQDQAAATVGYPTAGNVIALAQAFAAEAAAFGDVAAEYDSADALAVAIALGAAAVDLDPDDPEARLILARAYLSAPGTVEFHADAEAVLLPLLTLVPSDPRPRLMLARIAADMGDYAAAADVAVPLLETGLTDSDAAAVAMLIAGGYARAGNPQAGVGRLREALDRGPDWPAVRLALAVLLKHAGEADAAAREFRQVANSAGSPALRAVALRLAGASR